MKSGGKPREGPWLAASRFDTASWHYASMKANKFSHLERLIQSGFGKHADHFQRRHGPHTAGSPRRQTIIGCLCQCGMLWAAPLQELFINHLGRASPFIPLLTPSHGVIDTVDTV